MVIINRNLLRFRLGLLSVQENEKIKKLLCRPALGKAESSVYFLNEAIC